MTAAVVVHEAERPTSSTQVWITKKISRRRRAFEHTTTVRGLHVEVSENPGCVRWSANGYLADQNVRSWGFHWGPGNDVEEAKVAAIRAARRLYAAGVRPAPTDPLDEPPRVTEEQG